MTSIGRSAGARVLINDQYQMPFPEEDGHHAPPGFVTAFGLRKVKLKILTELFFERYNNFSQQCALSTLLPGKSFFFFSKSLLSNKQKQCSRDKWIEKEQEIQYFGKTWT